MEIVWKCESCGRSTGMDTCGKCSPALCCICLALQLHDYSAKPAPFESTAKEMEQLGVPMTGCDKP